MYLKNTFKPTLLFVFIVMAVSFSLTVPYTAYAKAAVERPATWATPVVKKALPNLFKVSDTLYRGAQPTRAGFLELKKMGIKTIVNLREHHTDKKLIAGIGFAYFLIPMSTTKPDKARYQKVLDIINNPEMQPVFVHCQHGADRTGTAMALYRITVQKWDTREAIRELQQGGYGHHTMFKEIIKFISNFNNQP